MEPNATQRDARSHVEDIFGQYLYALGAGGAPQWVTRHAVRSLRSHYLRSIQKAVEEGVDWDQSAPRVLDYVRAIGQLAGDGALRAGRHAIDAPDLERAIAAVERNYQPVPSLDASGPGALGKWCPPPSG